MFTVKERDYGADHGLTRGTKCLVEGVAIDYVAVSELLSNSIIQTRTVPNPPKRPLS